MFRFVSLGYTDLFCFLSLQVFHWLSSMAMEVSEHLKKDQEAVRRF